MWEAQSASLRHHFLLVSKQLRGLQLGLESWSAAGGSDVCERRITRQIATSQPKTTEHLRVVLADEVRDELDTKKNSVLHGVREEAGPRGLNYNYR